jgi:ABC-2 type transport system ATP-binding protein
VLVSSHVLHEVESMTRNVVLLYQGRVRAHGSIGEIRSLLDRYPHKILVRSPRARDLARALLDLDRVVAVRIAGDAVHVETHDPEALYERLPGLVLEQGLPVEALSSEDASLDAVFEYLVA